jgi:phage tail P2-like protein
MDRQAATSFLSYLSPALQNDRFFVALAETLDPLLQNYLNAIPVNRIICSLANQPPAVLDLLAVYHFNTDGYDTSFAYGTKLTLVQNSIINKIRKGTRAAVESLLSIAFASSAVIVEWFEDDPTGTTVEPNTFRIKIAPDQLIDPENVDKMIRLILKMKNARSYLSGISSLSVADKGTLYLSGNVSLLDTAVLPYRATIL